MGFTKFSWVLLGFIGFYWVLLGFTGFYWVLLGFTGFYWVFTRFYWVELCFFSTSHVNRETILTTPVMGLDWAAGAFR